jgi:hypothetical protein
VIRSIRSITTKNPRQNPFWQGVGCGTQAVRIHWFGQLGPVTVALHGTMVNVMGAPIVYV